MLSLTIAAVSHILVLHALQNGSPTTPILLTSYSSTEAIMIADDLVIV